MHNEPSLQASSISKAFATGKLIQQVIKESSLDIYPGELTLIIGPSGSGKSTMLSIMSGLLRPDSGTVQAFDTNLWSLDESSLDKFRLVHCGFIFQGFNLFSSLSALNNVALPLQYAGVKGKQGNEWAMQALEEVGLGHRSHLYPMELSGGEKQRVAIARALVKRPQLLFADEPTSALDKQNGEIVVALLQRIARSHNATVLGVTHDPRLLLHADRVIHLEDGIVTEDTRNGALKTN